MRYSYTSFQNDLFLLYNIFLQNDDNDIEEVIITVQEQPLPDCQTEERDALTTNTFDVSIVKCDLRYKCHYDIGISYEFL